MRLEILLLLAGWVCASFASAQASPGPSRIQQQAKKDKQIEAVAAPLQAQAQTQPAPVLTPPPAPAPETAPVVPPVVSWDGKLLTVDAENSSLTDILVAVRDKTGATMEFPASTASERVALHIGPAPVREVISSLLYGTNFDYIIQASEDDQDGLKSVVVTARGGDIADSPVVAGYAGTDANASPTGAPTGTGPFPARTPGMRMMKGWAAPGKPESQAAGEALLAAQEAAKDSAPADESSSAAEAPPAGNNSAAAGTETTSASSQANGDPHSTSPTVASSSSAASTVVETDLPPANAQASSSSSSSDSNDQSPSTQAIQNMQRMFEQRRQIQAQQNAPQPPPAAN